MNLNKLMKQAQKMQEQMAKTQAELETKIVEVSAGGGKVKVTANGAGDVIAIKIDKEVVDPNDVEFLETLLNETTGKDWTLKLSVKEQLPSRHSASSQTGKSSTADDFKDDPLIQEALEMFKGEIRS